MGDVFGIRNSGFFFCCIPCTINTSEACRFGEIVEPQDAFQLLLFCHFILVRKQAINNLYVLSILRCKVTG